MRLLVLRPAEAVILTRCWRQQKKARSKRLCGLICDKNCPAEEIAKSNSIPVSILKPNAYLSKDEYITELLNTVKTYSPDYILLAGYMRIIPSEFIDEYPLAILKCPSIDVAGIPGKGCYPPSI